MPRNIDPSSITTGTGLASQDSVQANALVSPTGSNDGLRVHIADPRRAHMARAIGVEDASDNFFSDDVEGALAELSGGAGATRSNGLIEGGTFAASSGLTFELDDPTRVLLGSGDVDFSGEQVVLADDATQYVWINSATGTLVASLSPPVLSDNPILIAEVTTAGGSITSSRDLRFFVFNLDRKNALIVRSSGSNFDQRAEANFLSLNAALAYLSLYAGFTGADSVETHRIIIRGNHSVTESLVLPVSGIQFIGDGDAQITATATVEPVFDLNNQESISFQNITFIADAPNSTAIGAPATSSGRLLVERCRFETASEDWDHAIDLTGAGFHTDFTIRNCRINIAADDAIAIDQAGGGTLASLVILGDGVGTGIRLMATPGGGLNKIQDCSISGFVEGISLEGDRNNVVNCRVENLQERGIRTFNGSQCSITGCQILMGNSIPQPAEIYGIDIGTTQTIVSGCSINSVRTGGGWTGPALVAGIRLNVGADDTTVHANVVTNFLNEFDNTGEGILVEQDTERCVLSANRVEVAGTGILSGVGCSDIKVRDNILMFTETGVSVTGERLMVSENNIVLDEDRGLTGITVSGAGAKVLGCSVHNPRTVWAGPDVPVGVFVAGGDRSLVSGCSIEGFLNSSGEGFGVRVAGGFTKITDNQIHNTNFGVSLGPGTDKCSVLSNALFEVGSGVHLEGESAAGTRCRRHTISDNHVQGALGHGILLFGCVHDCVVANNHLDLYVPANGANQTASGILVSIAGTDVPFNNLIEGNEVQRGREGITVTGDLDNRPYGIKVQNNLIHDCGRALDVSAIAAETFDVYPHGIGINHCDNCTVQGNTIRSLGVILTDADVAMFPDQGAGVDDVRSVGISVWNSKVTTVQGNLISNLLSENDGRAYGVYLRQGNSGSTIILEQNHHNIVGNTIEWQTGLAGFGLGVHGIWVEVTPDNDTGSSVLRDVRIHDNSVGRTHTSGIEVAVGDLGVLENLSISNNNLHHSCSGLAGSDEGAIRVHTLVAAAGTGVSTIRGVQINGNQVRASGSSGILSIAAQEGDFKNFQIHDNTLINPARAGILFIAAVDADDIVVTDWSVQGNQITGWGVLSPMEVLRVGVGFYDTGKSTSGFYRINVTNNSLVSDQADLTGIAVQTVDRDVESLHIAGNNISSSGDSTGDNRLLGDGIYIQVSRDTADPPAILAQANILDNTISCQDGKAIGIDVDSYVSELNVKGNTLAAIGTAQCMDFKFIWPDALAQSEYNQFVVEGNTLTGFSGCLIQSSRANIQNSSISNNTFRDMGEGVLVDVRNTGFNTSYVTRNLRVAGNTFRNILGFGVRLDLGASGSIQSSLFDNIQVVDNSFYLVGDAASHDVVSANMWGVLKNSTFSRNQFVKCLELFEGNSPASIRLRLGAGTLAGCIQVNVDENQMEDCGGTGILVDDTTAAAVLFTSNSLSVSRNTLYQTRNTEIFLDFNNFLFAQRTTVVGNLIRGTDAAPSSGDSYGIRLRGCSSAHNQIRVDWNDLRRSAWGAGTAIDVSTPGSMDMVSACGNTITNNEGSGISLICGGPASGANVSNNHVENVNSDAILLSSANWSSVEVSDNNTRACLRGFRFLGPLSVASISGNTCDTTENSHVCYDLQTPNLDEVSFTGNVARSNAAPSSISMRINTGASGGPHRAVSFVGNLFSTSVSGIVTQGATTFNDSLVVGNLYADGIGTGWGNGDVGTFTDPAIFSAASCTTENNQG